MCAILTSMSELWSRSVVKICGDLSAAALEDALSNHEN